MMRSDRKAAKTEFLKNKKQPLTRSRDYQMAEEQKPLVVLGKCMGTINSYFKKHPKEINKDQTSSVTRTAEWLLARKHRKPETRKEEKWNKGVKERTLNTKIIFCYRINMIAHLRFFR